MTILVKEKAPTKYVSKQDILLKEFERIRIENNGILKAEDVVNYAEDDTSPLHLFFQWDDSEAAHQYRIWQARQLISTVVVILPNTKKHISAYVSFKDSRRNDGGGYLPIATVLTNTEYRSRLLNEAFDDLRGWELKYHKLQELAKIYEAIKTTRKHFNKY
jgi:hypothetical protein